MSKVYITGSDFFAGTLEKIGYVRRTSLGEICVDDCPSDAAHLDAYTPPDLDRRNCRTLLSDLIPEEFLGRRGSLKITIEFDAEEPK